MHRRYFEHLYNEVCVAVDRRISRYDLWLLLWDGGGNPDELNRSQARHFVENNLSALLAREGIFLDRRSRQRLERSILQFNPQHPTPEEWFASSFEAITKSA